MLIQANDLTVKECCLQRRHISAIGKIVWTAIVFELLKYDYFFCKVGRSSIRRVEKQRSAVSGWRLLIRRSLLRECLIFLQNYPQQSSIYEQEHWSNSPKYTYSLLNRSKIVVSWHIWYCRIAEDDLFGGNYFATLRLSILLSKVVEQGIWCPLQHKLPQQTSLLESFSTKRGNGIFFFWKFDRLGRILNAAISPTKDSVYPGPWRR
jgi:hypothetical protein